MQCRLKTTLKQPFWQPFLIPEPETGALTRMNWIAHAGGDAAPEPPKPAKKKRAPAATLEPGPALEETDPPELHADDEAPAPLEGVGPSSMDLSADAPEGAEWPIDEGPDDAGGDDLVFDDVGDDHLDPIPGVAPAVSAKVRPFGKWFVP